MNQEQNNAAIRVMENELAERWANLPKWLEGDDVSPPKLHVDEVRYVADESLPNDTATAVFSSFSEGENNFAGFVVSWLVDRINLLADRNYVEGKLRILLIDVKSEIEYEFNEGFQGHRFTASVGAQVISEEK